MAEPRMFFDIDILYVNGERDAFTVEGGRDSMQSDNKRIRLLLKPDEQTIQEHVISRDHIARVSTTQRLVPDEVVQ